MRFIILDKFGKCFIGLFLILTTSNSGENSSILIDSKYDIVGTRIFGPLPFELRKKRYIKLLSLASTII